jgi:hypothetical protein
MEPSEPVQNSRFIRWLTPLAVLADNPISLIGVILVTTATISWFFLLPYLFEAHLDNPYFGILWVLDLAIFIFGLILIPIGAFMRRAKLRREGQPTTLALGSRGLRRLAMFVGFATLANIVIAGSLTTAAVNYMESKSFCGAACHAVMGPEFAAFQTSPHAGVDCVTCHAGPGASGFIKSKIAGSRQLVLLALGTYHKPIPVPVWNLPPASQSCGECHSLKGHPEDLVRVVNNYGDDEKNSLTHTVLLVYLEKIHRAHVGDRTIRYTADAKEETISKVELTANGKTTLFQPADAKAGDSAEWRTMDCLDCHNRPAHVFDQPDRAVNKAMQSGAIPSLPFVKKHAVETLKKGYKSQDEAATQIPATFASLFSGQPKADVDKASAALVAIYKANVFPEMKIDWGTYPSFLGHTDATGCFRCHDDAHVSPEKVTIGQDCSLCHNLAAMDEASPKVLSDLGLGK